MKTTACPRAARTDGMESRRALPWPGQSSHLTRSATHKRKSRHVTSLHIGRQTRSIAAPCCGRVRRRRRLQDGVCFTSARIPDSSISILVRGRDLTPDEVRAQGWAEVARSVVRISRKMPPSPGARLCKLHASVRWARLTRSLSVTLVVRSASFHILRLFDCYCWASLILAMIISGI